MVAKMLATWDLGCVIEGGGSWCILFDLLLFWIGWDGRVVDVRDMTLEKERDGGLLDRDDGADDNNRTGEEEEEDMEPDAPDDRRGG
jgi:hypothetical protein